MSPTPHDDLHPTARDHTQKEGSEESHCDLRVKHFHSPRMRHVRVRDVDQKLDMQTTSMQIEVAWRLMRPVDYKFEPRDFANGREIGVGLLGEDRQRALGENEFAIHELWVFPENLSDCQGRACLFEIAPIAQLGGGHFVLL